MKKIAVLCVAMVLLVPAASAGRKGSPTAPGVYKDWSGEIDSLEVVEQFTLADYGRVSIESLDTSDTPLPEPKDNTYQPVRSVLKNATTPFVDGLQKALREKTRLTVEQGSAKSGLVIRARVETMDPGSRAARYWAGFGAGAAKTKLVGEVRDAKRGKVLLRFEQERRSGVGAAGGDYESLMERNLRAIGKDVALALLAFQ